MGAEAEETEKGGARCGRYGMMYDIIPCTITTGLNAKGKPLYFSFCFFLFKEVSRYRRSREKD